jgi:hypothetical protein
MTIHLGADERGLYNAVLIAGRDLPEGFQIHVSIEKGASRVSLAYPGVPFHFAPDRDATLSQQILVCVQKAKTTPVVGLAEDFRAY